VRKGPIPITDTERRRVKVFAIVLASVLAVLVGRLVQVQLICATHYKEVAKDIHEERVMIAPKRGDITDRNGVVLARSLSTASVCASPRRIEDPRDASRKIARILGVSASSVLSKLSSGHRFAWLERDVPKDVCEKILDLEIEGVWHTSEMKRVYPFRELACHALGFTDIDGNGLAGLELYFDQELRGKERWVIKENDPVGTFQNSMEYLCAKPFDGYGITLTIDARCQQIVEDELRVGVHECGALSGTAIFVEPRTGSIVAMACYPGFDPNDPSRYEPSRWRNRTVSDVYEPGSTFKLVTASASLDCGLADTSTVIYAEQGKAVLGPCVIHDVKPHGWLRFSETMAYSSNICYAKLGMRLDPRQFYRSIKLFGFGSETGVTLPGEVSGIIRRPEDWSGRSLQTLAIGQEIAVTPLQLVMSYAAVTNDGVLMEPRIVEAITDENGQCVRPLPPREIRRVIDSEHARDIRRALRLAVVRGTGKKANVPETLVAGKTGTAEKADPDGNGYLPGVFVSSFVGFFPWDEPSLVGLVILDEPDGIYYASEVAAPVFARMAERMIRCLPDESVPRPTLRYIVNREIEGIPSVERSACDSLGGRVIVPDVAELTVREARREILLWNLTPVIKGSGIVVAQEPKPGATVPSGSRCVIRLGS
jgi:cell division protein FtsI (penicillin-binding protein 3)